MGWFKEETKQQVPAKKGEEFITDYASLVEEYNKLSARIDVFLTDGGEMIAPLYEQLWGSPENQLGGLANKLERLLNLSPGISKMEVGILTKEVLEKSKTHTLWNVKYTDYLEDFVFKRGFAFFTTSAFMIIDNLHAEIDKKMQEISSLKEIEKEYKNVMTRLREDTAKNREDAKKKGKKVSTPARMVQNDNVPNPFPPKLTKPEQDKLRTEYMHTFAELYDILQKEDESSAIICKQKLMSLSNTGGVDNPTKKKLIEEWYTDHMISIGKQPGFETGVALLCQKFVKKEIEKQKEKN